VRGSKGSGVFLERAEKNSLEKREASCWGGSRREGSKEPDLSWEVVSMLEQNPLREKTRRSIPVQPRVG
jgi:hypothetical protein